MRSPTALVIVGVVSVLLGCSDGGGGASWELVHDDLGGGLLSVWGTTTDDVWTVGGSRLDEPALAMHWDGAAWDTLDTGQLGVLWWVFGFAGGPVYLGGEAGTILRYQGGSFTRMTTPSTDTVFGIWGAGPDEVWAVGGSLGSGGVIWRLAGDAWVTAENLPAVVDTTMVWKVNGRSADDVWFVGESGLAVHWDGAAFSAGDSGVGESLLTVSCSAARCVAVGAAGGLSPVMVEQRGGETSWTDVEVPSVAGLVGVALTDALGVATGDDGFVLTDEGDGWAQTSTGLTAALAGRRLHGAWIDPDGGLWAVGGQVLAFPFAFGTLLHRGDPIAP